MLNATFAAPCLTTFCRLDELGLEAVGQRLEADRALIECRAAAGLGVSWHTANTAIIAEGKRRLIDDPTSFNAVTTIGVDDSPALRVCAGGAPQR